MDFRDWSGAFKTSIMDLAKTRVSGEMKRSSRVSSFAFKHRVNVKNLFGRHGCIIPPEFDHIVKKARGGKQVYPAKILIANGTMEIVLPKIIAEYLDAVGTKSLKASLKKKN